jgi:hypothetical protein
LTPRKDGDTDPPGWRYFFQEIYVSISRSDYFKDLLEDCKIAVHGLPDEDKPILIAAFIISDSLNGVRKTLLQQRSFYDKD